jgi:hypothetical protein
VVNSKRESLEALKKFNYNNETSFEWLPEDSKMKESIQMVKEGGASLVNEGFKEKVDKKLDKMMDEKLDSVLKDIPI